MSRRKLVYFAWVRERIGLPEETVDLPDDIRTAAELIEWLKGRGEEYQYAFENADVVQVAIDHEHVEQDAPLGEAGEIAFFPPMTGG
jgi:molybdopterin converting factor, subunit 1, non-archaeal